MSETHITSHYNIYKTIYGVVLILVLYVMTWVNVFAQKMVIITIPTDLTVTTILPESTIVAGSATTIQPEDNIQHTIMSTWSITSTWSAQSTWVESDIAIIYARKIEALITIKWQETRSNMLIVMNKFLAKYTPDHPVYATIQHMVDIIKLGEVANKLEYCTQFDDSYRLDLFGLQMKIYSTIKYSQTTKRCEMTFQYPDQSVHSCRFDEAQKQLVSKMIKDKQWLYHDIQWLWQSEKSSQIFESVIDSYLRDTTCFESKKAVVTTATTVNNVSGWNVTWLVDSWSSVVSWWKFTKK